MSAVMKEVAAPVRRNGRGAYLVVAPGTSKPVGYSRATSISSLLDDTGFLKDWGQRMTALGLAGRPDLFDALKNQDPTDTTAINSICRAALEASGANLRRDLGTLIHTYFERSCIDPTFETPEPYAADIAAIHAAISAAGYRLRPEFSEMVLVLDAHKIAGTADSVLERISDGALFIADLKTGRTLHPLNHAIQLAIYARADAIYRQGAATDGSEDIRLPMPEVSQETAIIIHCEPESGHCDLHELDIAAGLRALDVAMSIRNWRKAKLIKKIEGGGNVISPAALSAPSTEGKGTANAPAPSVGIIDAGESADREAAGVGPDAPSSPASDTSPLQMLQARTCWILDRIDAIKAAGLVAELGSSWPSGIATPKMLRDGEGLWVSDDIDGIDGTLTAIEAVHEIPFGPNDPQVVADLAEMIAEKQVQATPVERLQLPEVEEDDRIADPSDVARLRVSLAGMLRGDDASEKARGERVIRWVREGNRVRPWSMAAPGEPTPLRHWAISAAAVAATDLVDFDPPEGHSPDEGVRNALALVIGEDAHVPTFTVGALLGTLTFDQAIRLADLSAVVTP